MKSNAHIVTKNTFFQEANYYEPIKYEEQYNNDTCKRENEAIKDIINSNINSDIDLTITDVGCGTGLGKNLVDDRHQYVGIDRSLKSIEYCQEHYNEGLFYNLDAEEIAGEIDNVNPIFIFSLDYLSLEAIKEFIENTDKIFIAIHYNEPYLSQTSVYKDKEDVYRALHPIEKINAKKTLFERYNATTFKLLDEDYYFVTIIKKD